MIYEVIRLENGRYIFLNDHLNRLFNNLKKYNLTEIYDSIIEALEKFKKNHENVSVRILINIENKSFELDVLKIIETSMDEKVHGVKVGLYEFKRNRPDIKIYHKEMKEEVNSILEKAGLFELLLISDGYITEGSRSNIFYMLDGKLFTPPSHDVLPGIVKKNFIQMLKQNDITFSERQLSCDEIDKIDGILLTGTGMDVTNVMCVEKINYNNSFLKKLVIDFQEYKKITA